jgi:two-component system invasion response regulator UvrY
MGDPTQEKLRILILEDQIVVRQAIKQMVLDVRFDPLEFGESNAGPEGLDLALGRPWDLVIVREGLEVLTELKRMRPDQLIFVLTLRSIESQIEVTNNPGDRVSAVRRILAGGTSGQSITSMEAPSDLLARPCHENLSNREREVLRLLGFGRTMKEIAGALALSEKTISTYRSRILTKLGLRTTAELVRYAVRNLLAD